METIDLDIIPDTLHVSGIIDLDADNSNDDVIEIFEILEDAENENQNQANICKFDDIFKENHILGDFIEKCIALDDSGAMQRVMLKVLVPLYKTCTKDFKSSAIFEKALNKALAKIENIPTYKYSHVKEFCETLKLYKDYTLKLTQNFSKRKYTYTKPPKASTSYKDEFSYHNRFKRKRGRPKKNRRISSASSSCDEEISVDNPRKSPSQEPLLLTDVINIDDDDSDTPVSVELDKMELIEIEYTNDIIKKVTKVPANKQKKYKKVTKLLTVDEMVSNNYSTVCSLDSVLTNGTNEKSSTDMFEVVHDDCQKDYSKEIKKIEKAIGKYKLLVDELNEQEVTDYSGNSPYIICDQFQARIVKLYEALCLLTKQSAVKRREVRLYAVNGKSELPIKNLEMLINKNIKSDGLPHFPDFYEVLDCVKEANRSGNLGWDRNTEMEEARALFANCGRALQKKRQQREWRDLLGIAGDELMEDPADSDPVLQAKLEANRKRAVTKESELLQKYASMETTAHTQLKDLLESDDSVSDEESIQVMETQPVQQCELKITRVFSCKDINNSSASTNNDNLVVPDSSNNEIRNNTDVEVTNQTVAPDTPPNIECTSSLEPALNETRVDEDNIDMQCSNVSSSFNDTCVNVSTEEIEDKSEDNQAVICVADSGNTDQSNNINSSNPEVAATDTSKESRTGVTDVVTNPIDINIIRTETVNENPTILSSDIKNNNTEQNLAEHVGSKTRDLNVNESTHDGKVCDNIGDTNLVEHVANVHTSIINPPIEKSSDVENNTAEYVLRSEKYDIDKIEVMSIEIESIDENNESNNTISMETEQENAGHKNNVEVEQEILQDSRIGSTDSELRNINNDKLDCQPDNSGEVKVKSELDLEKIKNEANYNIVNGLNELGDNYTTTVIDILDPFLIVEVSSDSSSDDELDSDNENTCHTESDMMEYDDHT